MVNVAVWPYQTGEVVLQNYNVLLTLSSLLSHSDGIIPVYNDEVMGACRNLLKIKRPSYKVMNNVIAQSLLGVLFPASNSGTSEKLGIWDSTLGNSLTSLVSHLCPLPQYRLLTLKTIPLCDSTVSAFNSDLWDSLLSRIK